MQYGRTRLGDVPAPINSRRKHAYNVLGNCTSVQLYNCIYMFYGEPGGSQNICKNVYFF